MRAAFRAAIACHTAGASGTCGSEGSEMIGVARTVLVKH